MQFARVALNGGDVRILTQLPVKLLHVYVNSIDSRCAMLEQAVCEAAVRGANIQTNAAARVNGKVFQCAFQLQTATADEFPRSADNFNAGVIRNGHASLSRSLAFHLNFTSENHGYSFLGRVGEASLNEKKIEPFASCSWFHDASNNQARRSTRNSAISRIRTARSKEGSS